MYPLKYTLKNLQLVDNNTHKNPLPFHQCSFSLSISLNRLRLTGQWMSAAVPLSRSCTNQSMFIPRSADLDCNNCRACDPQQMYQVWIFVICEDGCVYRHSQVAHAWCRICEHPHCLRVAQVAFLVDVRSDLVSTICVAHVEVQQICWDSSVAVDSVVYDFGKKCSRPIDCLEAEPSAFPSQLSHVYAQETELRDSSLLKFRSDVSWSDIAFLPSRRANTLLWPLLPHST
jgi:hypothetical protein